MTESNNITAVIRGISKFDGTPAKYLDWKRAVSATLPLTRPDIYEIIDGAACPKEFFQEFSYFQLMKRRSIKEGTSLVDKTLIECTNDKNEMKYWGRGT